MRILIILLVSLAVSCNVSNSADFKVTSNSFKHDEMMPLKYSCQGDDISPALKISGVPEEAKTLAIIMHDPDAPMDGGFTHWVAWNIDPAADIAEGFNGGAQGLNTAGQSGYVGMCPPSGTHHYHFMIYALDTELDLGSNTDKAALEKAMNGHIVAQDVLTGLYKKK